MTAYYEGYSQTSASNNSAAPNGAPEGMAPSGFNDVMRQIMASIAQMRDNKAQEDRNFFVDPCCRVAQIGTAGTIPTLTTSYKYGVVDLVQCKATGTAVSAGTITQDSATTVSTGVTPYSAKIAGATVTGTGKVFFRKWIESRDSQALNGQAVIFSVKCRQDTGGSINAFLTLNKFQSVDSAGTPVQLATNSGAVTAVANTTDVIVSLAYTFGASDGANGVELILEMDCGAVTTKNFYATDWQARIGTAVRGCRAPAFAEDMGAALRYFESSYDYGVAPGTATPSGDIAFRLGAALINTATALDFTPRYSAPKVIAPTVTLYSYNSGASGKVYDNTAAADKVCAASLITRSGYLIQNNSGGTLATGDSIRFMHTLDARL